MFAIFTHRHVRSPPRQQKKKEGQIRELHRICWGKGRSLGYWKWGIKYPEYQQQQQQNTRSHTNTRHHIQQSSSSSPAIAIDSRVQIKCCDAWLMMMPFRLSIRRFYNCRCHFPFFLLLMFVIADNNNNIMHTCLGVCVCVQPIYLFYASIKMLAPSHWSRAGDKSSAQTWNSWRGKCWEILWKINFYAKLWKE